MAFHSKCQQRSVLRLKQMGLAESADALPVWGKTHLATNTILMQEAACWAQKI